MLVVLFIANLLTMYIPKSFLVSASEISVSCVNPEMVLETMKLTFTTSMKFQQSRYVFDLFSQLRKKNIGTTNVEEACRKMCSRIGVEKRSSLVERSMTWKLRDARQCMRKAQYENTKVWRNARRMLRQQGVCRKYEDLWSRELRKYKEVLCKRRKKKVEFLSQKYNRKPNLPDRVHGVIVADQEIPENFTSEPRCYGSVQISSDEKAVLSLPPKFATFDRIDKLRCEGEVEKGLAKLRWSRKREDSEHRDIEQDRFYRETEKVFDFGKMRATDFPFNPRITLPEPIDRREEIRMIALKNRLGAITDEYISSKSDEDLQSNLDPLQKRGLQSLRKKVENGEVVVYQTDKSGRFSVDRCENYKKAMEPHLQGSLVTTEECISIEEIITAHAISWTRILAIGSLVNQQDRVRKCMNSQFSPMPPLYGLRKDHKDLPLDKIVEGPPARPVCGVNSSPNHKLSYLLSTILSELWKEDKDSVCLSTEEMLAGFAKVNTEQVTVPIVIGSADVKALYPSLDIEFTVEKVCELFYESSITIEGVNYKELGLYIALNSRTVTEELREVVPTRKTRLGRPPLITRSGIAINEEDRFGPWLPPSRQATEVEKRLMIKEALKIALKLVMKNHTYVFDSKVRKQEEGGAIGLDLTGTLAQVFMIWWDREVRRKLAMLGINVRLYLRYVDDINIVIEVPRRGARYKSGKLTYLKEDADSDKEIEDDKRAMLLFQEVGNSIHKSIQVEIEVASKFADRKMPILDLKVWIEVREAVYLILHEFYMKDVSSKSVVLARSALSWPVKRTVLTQEALRIMMNCSPLLSAQEVSKHLSHFSLRMQYSGYSQKFRGEIVNSACNAYKEIKAQVDSGSRPLYRPREWQRDERNRSKRDKQLNWYKKGGYESVIFVPATPNSELQKKYSNEVTKSGLKIRIVERAGKSIKSFLQRSDPFTDKNCNQEDCMLCKSGGRGSCRVNNVEYNIKCVGCKEDNAVLDSVYKGETYRNCYVRGKEHLKDLNNKLESSSLWRHCREKHGSEVQKFEMNQIASYRNDSMLRQIMEAVRISNSDSENLMNSKKEWNHFQLTDVVLGGRNNRSNSQQDR